MRHLLDIRMILEETKTLIQGNRMRQDAADVTEARTWHRDELVGDANACFSHNGELIFEEMIVILVDASVKGVLYRQNRVGDTTSLKGPENVVKADARDYLDSGAKQFSGGSMAEGTGLSLESNQYLIRFWHRRYHPTWTL